MKRFFLSDYRAGSTRTLLDRDESHHLRRVLRLQPGDEVELLDGTGKSYAGRIETMGDLVEVSVLKELAVTPDSPYSLWVCQGDLKGRKMDELVQKCTELGVQRFVPFYSSRSQGRVDRKRWQRRRERWLATVKSACKQSGRLTLMEIGSECGLGTLLAQEQYQSGTEKLLFWEDEPKVRLTDIEFSGSTSPVCLMFGPEGGITEEEVAQARQQGWRTVSLGRQVLRAETATLAAVSIVQHLLGTI